MAALTITDAVLFTGEELVAVLQSLRLAQRVRRQLDGYNSPTLERLASQCQSVLAARGHADTPQSAIPEDQGVGEYLTTAEAAERLGCSPRTLRRRAPSLSGRLSGGQWLIPTQAVRDHMEGSDRDG